MFPGLFQRVALHGGALGLVAKAVSGHSTVRMHFAILPPWVRCAGALLRFFENLFFTLFRHSRVHKEMRVSLVAWLNVFLAHLRVNLCMKGLIP